MKIQVKITPWAKKKQISIVQDLLTWQDIYMVKVHAKPVDGQANKALINDLAEYFDLPRRKITILSGYTSRLKVVEIDM